MKVNNHAVAVTTLFCFYLAIGSINMITLLIASGLKKELHYFNVLLSNLLF